MIRLFAFLNMTGDRIIKLFQKAAKLGGDPAWLCGLMHTLDQQEMPALSTWISSHSLNAKLVIGRWLWPAKVKSAGASGQL